MQAFSGALPLSSGALTGALARRYLPVPFPCSSVQTLSQLLLRTPSARVESNVRLLILPSSRRQESA